MLLFFVHTNDDIVSLSSTHVHLLQSITKKEEKRDNFFNIYFKIKYLKLV